MPIPNPQSGESQDEFVSRCISEISNEYEQEQAAAICYTKYRENMNSIKRKNEQKSVLARMNKYREDELKGINLNEDGSYDLKEPCWDGYEQYGTKIVDGREVPNCIPID